MAGTNGGVERVAVLGASGLVGRSLVPLLAAARPVEVIATALTDAHPLPGGLAARRMDVHDTVQLANLLHDLRPATVIIATRFSRGADYTPEQMGFEVKLVRRLASWLEKTNGRLVLLSTASVFSGRLGGYREEDEPDPVTRYGETRAEMERQMAQLGVKHLIVRLGRINGFRPGRPTRFEALWRALRAGEKPALHANVRQNPLGAAAAARAIAALWAADVEGTWHVAGRENLTDLEYGRRVAVAMGLPAESAVEAGAGAAAAPPPPTVELTIDPTRVRRKLSALGVELPALDADLTEVLEGAPL